jgi:hypothetical protein
MQTHGKDSFRPRWPCIKTAVGADRVVLPLPVLDNDLGLFQRKEQFPIQQLISEFSVEALVIAVLPEVAGFDNKIIHRRPKNKLGIYREIFGNRTIRYMTKI